MMIQIVLDHQVKQYTSVISFQLPVYCTALRMLAIAHLFFTMSSWRERLLAYSLPFQMSKVFSFFRHVSTSFFNFSSWILIQMSEDSVPWWVLLLSSLSITSFRDATSFFKLLIQLLRQFSFYFFMSVIFLSSSSFFYSCFYSIYTFFLQSTVLSSLMSLRVAILKFLLSSFISLILFWSYQTYCSYYSLFFWILTSKLLTLFCHSRFSLSSAQILDFRSVMISSLFLRDCQKTSIQRVDSRLILSKLDIFSFSDLIQCQLPFAMCLVLYWKLKAVFLSFYISAWQDFISSLSWVMIWLSLIALLLCYFRSSSFSFLKFFISAIIFCSSSSFLCVSYTSLTSFYLIFFQKSWAVFSKIAYLLSNLEYLSLYYSIFDSQSKFALLSILVYFSSASLILFPLSRLLYFFITLFWFSQLWLSWILASGCGGSKNTVLYRPLSALYGRVWSYYSSLGCFTFSFVFGTSSSNRRSLVFFGQSALLGGSAVFFSSQIFTSALKMREIMGFSCVNLFVLLFPSRISLMLIFFPMRSFFPSISRAISKSTSLLQKHCVSELKGRVVSRLSILLKVIFSWGLVNLTGSVLSILTARLFPFASSALNLKMAICSLRHFQNLTSRERGQKNKVTGLLIILNKLFIIFLL